MKTGLLVLLLLGFDLALRAQEPSTTLTGRVTDGKTGEALAFATVYVNATTRGTTTDDQGRYRLTNVPLGTVEIVASYAGYASVRRAIRLTNLAGSRLDLALQPGITLQETTVTAKRSGVWKRRFDRFERELLGETPFASQCSILNRTAVTLTDEDGILRATAPEPLVIENRALGYRIRCDLTYFEVSRGAAYYAGSSQFEELKPADDREAARWQRNRRRAYEGSTRHLLASLVAGTFEREGFSVFLSDLNVPANGPLLMPGSDLREHARLLTRADTLFKAGELPFEHQFFLSKPLEIFYRRVQSRTSPYRSMPYAYSVLTLPRGWMLITTDGRVPRPEGMVMRGYLGDDRLSSLLPDDWRPDPKVAEPSTTVAGTLLPPDERLDSLARLTARRYRREVPTGWLLTDKPLYATGDVLHLSACLPVPDGTPDSDAVGLDEALHAELFTPDGRLVQHRYLRSRAGWSAGDFRLSDSLGSGTYRLRVYPVAARAGLERTFVVYNPLREVPRRPAAVDRLRLRVEPLGGTWVAGLPAALRVTTEVEGRGRSTFGVLRDDRDTVVARFTTSAAGLTHLDLTPAPGRWYHAEARTLDGDQRVDLPPAEPAGLSVQAEVSTATNQILAHLRATGPYAAAPLYLLGYAANGLRARARLRLSRGEVQVALPLDGWPTGTGWLAVFDSTGRRWAEQPVAVPNPLSTVALELVGKPPAGYAPRDTLRLGLTLGVESVLALTVTDAGQVPSDSLSESGRTAVLSPDSGLGIPLRGRVLDRRGRPLPDASLLLTFADRDGDFARTTRSDAAGTFRLVNLDWADTAQVRMRVMNAKFKTLDAAVELDRPGQPRADSTAAPDWSPLEPYLRAARLRQDADPEQYRQRDARQLAEVVVRGRRNPVKTWNDKRLRLHGEPDRAVDFEEGSTGQFANVYELLRNRVPGVQVQVDAPSGRYVVTIRGGMTALNGLPQSPLVVIDGVTFDDPNALDLVTPSEVERIEVVMNSGAASYGARGANGIIAVFTRKPKADSPTSEPEVPTLSLLGFATPQPLAPPRRGTPDRRDVLAWYPQLPTDDRGRVTVPVVLSDDVRTLRVVGRGGTSEGQPVWFEQILLLR